MNHGSPTAPLVALALMLVAPSSSCARYPDPGPCSPEIGGRYISCTEGISAILDTSRTVEDASNTEHAEDEGTAQYPERVARTGAPDSFVAWEVAVAHSSGALRQTGVAVFESSPVSMMITDRYARLAVRARPDGALLFLGEFVEVPLGLFMYAFFAPAFAAGAPRHKQHARLQNPSASVVRRHAVRGYVPSMQYIALISLDPSIGILFTNFKTKFDFKVTETLADGPSENTTIRTPVGSACLLVEGESGQIEVTTDGSGQAVVSSEYWPIRGVTTCGGKQLERLSLDLRRGVQPSEPQANIETPAEQFIEDGGDSTN